MKSIIYTLSGNFRNNIRFTAACFILFFLFIASSGKAMPKDPSILKEFPESDLSRRELLLHKRMDIKRPSGISNLNVQGTKKILVILVKAKDQNPGYNTTDFQNLLFSSGIHPTGSLADYFSEVSTGKLNITGSVVGWFTASQDYSYYTNGESGIGLPSDPHWPRNAAKLAGEAIDAAYNAGVDFSQFDNDKNGEIDGVLIVHPGPGSESVSEADEPNNIWSHKWDLYSGGDSTRSYNNTKINDYAMVPEKNVNGNLIEIGVFCHEFGHFLGLPELYDTKYQSYGNGVYDLMANGSWGGDGKHPETPTHLSAWSKYYLGWANINNYTGINGDKNLSQVEGSNDIIKIDAGSKEYFLICNRQKTNFDQYLPGSGLLIWHVDENRIDADWYKGALNNNPSAQSIALVESDGLFNLQKTKNQGGNDGDSGDFFPGSSNNTVFSAISNPSSEKNDGGKSGVSIINISPSSLTMTFMLGSSTAITHIPNISEVFSFPNPFQYKKNKEMIIKFPDNLSINLKIYNIAGELIRTLDDGSKELDITRGEAYWDGKNDDGFLVSSGLYIYILDSPEGKKKGKILFIK